jgi:hypothetical protein
METFRKWTWRIAPWVILYALAMGGLAPKRWG